MLSCLLSLLIPVILISPARRDAPLVALAATHCTPLICARKSPDKATGFSTLVSLRQENSPETPKATTRTQIAALFFIMSMNVDECPIKLILYALIAKLFHKIRWHDCQS